MKGFLHCVRAPEVHFWAIFTQKTVLTLTTMTTLEKHLNLTLRLPMRSFSQNTRSMQGFVHCVRPKGMDFLSYFYSKKKEKHNLEKGFLHSVRPPEVHFSPTGHKCCATRWGIPVGPKVPVIILWECIFQLFLLKKWP